MSDSYRILCTGDVHLGRHPARVPARDETVTVEHAWRQCVDAALQRDVDAVVLTGDVVDRENKMYEAFGALQRGVERLTEAEIDVVAVAGNHDFDTLPRLMDGISAPRFHLLGQGGQWETVTLPAEKPRVRFVGWSFPEAHVVDSPLGALSLESTSLPTIGVLHADVGSRQSQYLPVTRRALGRHPVAAWLLGHLHAPAVHRDGDQLQLYTGSLQPLDPGETGRHGAWVIEVPPSRRVQARPVPLATVRYTPVRVDVSDLETKEEVERAVLESARDRLGTIVAETPHVRRVVMRLHIEGRTTLQRDLQSLADQLVNDLEVHVGEAAATLDTVTLDTRPAHDLEALAEGNDAPAVLAQLLLDLQDGADTDEVATVVHEAREAAQSVHDAPGYEPLRRDAATQDLPPDDDLRDVLLRRGFLLLDALQEQTASGRGS